MFCFRPPPQQPITCLPAPLGINGVFLQNNSPGVNINFQAPLNRLAIPPCPPPLPPQSEKKPEKKPEAKKEPPKKNYYAPPSLGPGMNFMFPIETTILSIFSKAAKVWNKKYKDVGLAFKTYKVNTQDTVKSVIDRTLHIEKLEDAAEKCKGWAITEVIDTGDCKWTKGTTIEYTSDKANGTLASMGWTAKRGDSTPPVWVTVHKA